ncbi:GPI mannosyltransferase 4-like isoform X2 [Watersipora subatra]
MQIAAILGSSPYLAGSLSATSYVTVVFYTRTFSNSIESFFFSLLLLFVCQYLHLCVSAGSSSNIPRAPPDKSRESPSASKENGFKGIPAKPHTATDPVQSVSDSSTEPVRPVSNSTTDSSQPESKGTTDPSRPDAPNGDHFDAANSSSDDCIPGAVVLSKMGQLMEKHRQITDDGLEKPSNKDSEELRRIRRNKASIIITVIIVAGVWNRPTFIGYALVPGLYWLFQGKRPSSLKDILLAGVRGLLNLPYVINTALIFILFDTSYYRSKRFSVDYNLLDQFIITPLNFLLYNKNSSNLAQHGLHPRYLHVLVNAPLLFGPLIAFLIIFIYMAFCIHNNGHRKILVMLFLGLVTPLSLLSVFPHQEARFIIPMLVPSVLITAYALSLINSKVLYAIFFLFWIPHNIIFGVFFGAAHQGGVVPSLLYLHKQKVEGAFNGGVTLVYHRTYMPPRSLLQLYRHESRHVRLIDLQGKVDDSQLADELIQYDTFHLITPYHLDRLQLLLHDKFSIKKEVSFYPHVSFEDPPDLEALYVYDTYGLVDWEATWASIEESLTLSIYRVTNRNVIVQTYPSSGDSDNLKENIDLGAYETMAITLPKAQMFSM